MRNALSKTASTLLLLASCVLVVSPSSVLAQGSSQVPSAGPGFGDTQPGGAQGKSAEERKSVSGTSVLSGNHDATASTEILNSVGESETDANGFNSLNSSTTNNVATVFQDPESGVSSIMQKNTWRRMSTNLLNSPLTLMHVTWQLTEPAVAQGFANAFQQSAMINQLAYSSTQVLNEQYKLGGTQGFSQAVSDLNCQRGQILEQQKRNEPEDWQAARMACQGAYDTSLATGPGGSGAATQEPKVDGTIAALSNDSSLNVVDCKKMEEDRQSELSKPAKDRTKGIMSFVDVKLQNLTEDERSKYRESYGDIIYAYTTEFDTTNSNKPARAVLLATCVKPPSKPTWKQAQELELIQWKAMLKMFEERCVSAAKEKLAQDQYTPFDPSKRNSFIENSENWIQQFSFDQFRFTPNLIDIMYNLFIAKEIKELTEDSCKARLSPDVDRNNLEKLKKGLVRTRLEHRVAHQLVLWITTGQMYEKAKKAVLKVNATAQGMNQQLDGRIAVVPAFYYMIARSVNLNSIEELGQAMDENIAQIMAWKKQMEDQAAMTTGKGGAVLKSPFDGTNQARGYGN